MRIRVLSDLHEEYASKLGALEFEAIAADVTILAGDIANGVDAVAVAARAAFAQSQVILVPGNHEYYGGRLGSVLQAMRQAASALPNVHILDQNSITIQGVRFLGATLWTDYALHGEDTVEDAIESATPRMVDYRMIRTDSGELFSAEDSIAIHRRDRAWLATELCHRTIEKTVVVTHHAPHPLSVHPRFAGNSANPAFVSDLSELMGRSQLWVHGHAHNGFDYEVAGTRVVANPAGYRKKRLSPDFLPGVAPTSAPADHQHWQFENSIFDAGFVVEL
jgi:Icc-related predicted phosphoesterase